MKGVFWGILFIATLTFGQNTNHPEINKQVSCRTCHSCDVPTKQDPCLNACPREMMITVDQSPEKGPDVVKIDQLEEKYLPVVFSHKVHAQMSQISGGCAGCHHYNTAGPILPCSSCHSVDRKREDVSKPDLQAAFHRQCITCHKEWSYSTDCNSCHEPKSSSELTATKEKVEKKKGKDHPVVLEPTKLIYETNYDDGKIVTFYHDQHVDLFGSDCVSCHQKENCTRCHDKARNEKVISSNMPVKITKSPSEHHQPCFKCHENDDCSKCHLNKAMEPFNHKNSTGWALNRFHNKLECATCHVNNKFTKLNNECTFCHNDFTVDLFDHAITGLKLDELHSTFDCGDCHIDNNFAVSPGCENCHEDLNFPKDKPGTMVKISGK